MADTQYKDILIRDNLSDTGTIPRTGSWTNCPDIIPYGTAPVADPQTVFTNNFSTNPGKALTANAPNYIYVRGKNYKDAAVDGTAHLFYSPSNLVLYPSMWTQNKLTTSGGVDSSAANASGKDAIAVTVDPFSWQPDMPQPGSHYCLIALISTPDHPYANQLPGDDITSVQDLANWIYQTGGAGWHNVQTNDTDSPTWTTKTKYTHGTAQATVLVSIMCENVPVGADVAFSTGTPLPDGTVINLPKTQVTKSTEFTVGSQYVIPQGYSTDISYSYWSNGHAKLPGFSITINTAVITNGEDFETNIGTPYRKLFPEAYYYCPKQKKLVEPPNETHDSSMVCYGYHTTVIAD